MKLEDRILKLKSDLLQLTREHDKMIAEKNQKDQEFQQTIVRNQNRWQQIAGAIAELELMQRETQEGDGGELAPANRVELNR